MGTQNTWGLDEEEDEEDEEESVREEQANVSVMEEEHNQKEGSRGGYSLLLSNRFLDQV